MASQTQRSAPKPIYSVAKEEVVSILATISGDSREFLAIGDRAGNLEIYSLETYRKLSSHKADSSLLTIKQQPDSAHFISQSRSSQVQLWKFEGSNLVNIKSLSYDYGHLCSLEVTKTRIVLPTTRAGVIELLNSDLDLLKEIRLCDKSGDLMCIKVTDGDICAVGFELNLELVDIESGERLSSCHLGQSLMCLTFSAKFSRLYCGTAENVTVVKIDGNKSVDVERILDLPETGVGSIAVRYDEKIFACGCWDGRIRVYSCKSLKPLVVLNFHDKSVTSLVFTKTTSSVWNKMMLVAAGEDGQISVWDIYN